MERRDVLKKIGLASIIGITGLVAAACENKESRSAAAEAAAAGEGSESSPQKKVAKTEREKLIINRNRMSFANPANPTKAELKHTPQITFDATDKDDFVKINVVVGSEGIIHPATKSHWIDYLTFFVNGQKKSHIENENGEIRGNAQFWYKLNAGDIVKIESGCNLHGIWENQSKFVSE